MNTEISGGKWIVDAPSKLLNTQIKIDQEERIVIAVTYEYGIVIEFTMQLNGDVTIWSRKLEGEIPENTAEIIDSI